MAKSCSILAHCKNTKGEEVESRLFKDLLQFTSNNRPLAIEYYKVGTDSRFLDKVRNEAKFDENGEITFQSLRKLAKIDIAKDKILQELNKDMGSGEYEYGEIIPKLQSFNRNSQFKDEFLATIEPAKNGKYMFSIVDKNTSNLDKLYKTIANRSKQDRLVFYLNRDGVNVEFLKENEGSRYSTENVAKTADGLYNLIKISRGEKSEEALAEESGHFVVGTMKDSPLIERLLSLLDEDTQREVLGDEYNTKALGNNPRREVAGVLVGKALMDLPIHNKPISKLLGRIVIAAKKLFNKVKGNEIANALIDAESIARKIAEGYASHHFNGTLENALSTKETLWSASLPINVIAYRELSNSLKLAITKLKNINPELNKEVTNILGLMEVGKYSTIMDPNKGFIREMMSLSSIAEAMEQISDLLSQEIPSILASVDFSDAKMFDRKMVQNSNALQTVRTFLIASLAIEEMLSNFMPTRYGNESLVGDLSKVQVTDKMGNISHINLVKTLDLVSKMNSSLRTDLEHREKQYYLKYAEGVLGSKYVNRAARVLFNFNPKKGKFLQFEKASKVSVESQLTALEEDISWARLNWSSMSNNPDLMGQLADRTTKEANKVADELTIVAQERLRELQAKLKKLGHSNTDIFMEKSSRDGKVTGNIVSKYNWGDYETDWIEFKQNVIKEFKDANPDLDSMSDMEKGIKWQQFFKPKARLWHYGDATHSAHSTWDNTNKLYVPNVDSNRGVNYSNNQYSSLTTEEKAWLDEYMELKTNLDARLQEGAMPRHRAPQFKGSFSNKVRNRKLFEGTASALGGTLRSTLVDTFCEDSEDIDYGSYQTYNTIEDDIFSNELYFEKEKVNRIPVFGINKLKDVENISTDLFHSTLAYASMANSYMALSMISNTLEIGTEVLARRKVGGMTSERDSKTGFSNAYRRYMKHLEKQVYGVGIKRIKIGKKIVANKIAGVLSSVASGLYLGGNVVGATVNVGTGAIELIKEAFASEHFSIKDLLRANKLYFENLPSNLLAVGKDIKEDKVSLLIKKFDALNKNKSESRNWRTRDARITNFFDGILFLPYKTGDHYMSSMAYLALSTNTKLYDLSGKETSLYDAYKVTDLSEKGAGKTLALDQVYLKDKNTIDEYKRLEGIVSKIERYLAQPMSLTNALILSADEQDYLKTHGYNIAEPHRDIDNLREAMHNLTWTVLDESHFEDKAREINIRMHGIYNNADKVVWQQNILGDMILVMRGYALGMAERRFGGSKYSVVLGQESEGSIVTLAKVLASTFTDQGGFGLTLRALALPVSKSTKDAMLKAGFSANQYANMRRNMADFIIIGALWALTLLTAKGGEGDDDEEDKDSLYAEYGSSSVPDAFDIIGIIYYFSSRLLREQEAFTTIRGLYSETPNLMNLIPIGASALYDIADWSYRFAGSPFAEETDSQFYYQRRKKCVYEKYDPKWEVKFRRMFPYLRSYYVLEHPYEAAEAYEYGRKTK